MEKISSVPLMEAKRHRLDSKEEKEEKKEEKEGERRRGRRKKEGRTCSDTITNSRGEAGGCAPMSEHLL